MCKYCHAYSGLIPLSFVLGFYVNLVVKRWQEMYQSIPSTDTLALFVSNSIHGQVTSALKKPVSENNLHYVVFNNKCKLG